MENLLGDSHQAVYGEQLQDFILTGTIGGRFYGLYQGIPMVQYGPNFKNIHSFDEAVEIKSIRKVTQTVALFIANWCGLEKI